MPSASTLESHMADILRYTPTWVWGLLAALLALGYWQSRPRNVARAGLLALPLVLLSLGLWSTWSSFAALPLAAGLWLSALAASFFAARRLQAPDGTRWDAVSKRLHLPGSWLPLALIVTIFTLRYSATVALVLHPAWRGDPGLVLPLAALYGGLGGLFLGRAVGLLALTRAPQATISVDEQRTQLS
jgi:hypothetical protein